MKTAPIFPAIGVLFFTAQSFAAQEFLVTRVRGSAQVGQAQKSYQAAEAKKNYPLGWWAKTGAGQSSLDVDLSPGNSFVLMPNSEVQITDQTSRSAGFRRKLKLNDGKVDLTLKPGGGKSIEVETPTAVCGAVGTVFEVNAAASDFQITAGSVYLLTKGDNTFRGDAISGRVSVDPGKENAYVSGTVSGKFAVNEETVVAQGATLEVAKQLKTGPAALEVSKGAIQTSSKFTVVEEQTATGGAPAPVVTNKIPAGSYVMEKNTLVRVSGPTKEIHRKYRAAAKREGDLGVQKAVYTAKRQRPPATLQAELNAAARVATDLRKQLFQRRTIRNVNREIVRSVMRH